MEKIMEENTQIDATEVVDESTDGIKQLREEYKKLKAEDGKVVIAVVDNELTVKRYRKKGKNIILEPENNAFDPIVVPRESEAFVWGVVTNVIHNL